MRKTDVIKAFEDGGKIRLTRGIWSSPTRDGKIAENIEEIERFYEGSFVVANAKIEKGIIDLIGINSEGY